MFTGYFLLVISSRKYRLFWIFVELLRFQVEVCRVHVGFWVEGNFLSVSNQISSSFFVKFPDTRPAQDSAVNVNNKYNILLISYRKKIPVVRNQSTTPFLPYSLHIVESELCLLRQRYSFFLIVVIFTNIILSYSFIYCSPSRSLSRLPAGSATAQFCIAFIFLLRPQ